MNPLRTHLLRVAALVALVLISGATFFFFQNGSSHEPAIPAPETAAVPEAIPALTHFPDPSLFTRFTYDAAAPSVHVEGSCNDAYYAILIFADGVDYRVSPLDARYNAAFPCTGGSFSQDIPLANLPLTSGGRYYVIHASEGERGIWHDVY